jgi:hypothetical protein
VLRLGHTSTRKKILSVFRILRGGESVQSGRGEDGMHRRTTIPLEHPLTSRTAYLLWSRWSAVMVLAVKILPVTLVSWLCLADSESRARHPPRLSGRAVKALESMAGTYHLVGQA